MSDFSKRVERGTRRLLRAKTDAGRNRALHFMVNTRSIPPSEAVVDGKGGWADLLETALVVATAQGFSEMARSRALDCIKAVLMRGLFDWYSNGSVVGGATRVSRWWTSYALVLIEVGPWKVGSSYPNVAQREMLARKEIKRTAPGMWARQLVQRGGWMAGAEMLRQLTDEEVPRVRDLAVRLERRRLKNAPADGGPMLELKKAVAAALVPKEGTEVTIKVTVDRYLGPQVQVEVKSRAGSGSGTYLASKWHEAWTRFAADARASLGDTQDCSPLFGGEDA